MFFKRDKTDRDSNIKVVWTHRKTVSNKQLLKSTAPEVNSLPSLSHRIHMISDRELRAQTLEEVAHQGTLLRAQELRQQKLEDAALQLSLLRAKSRDGSIEAKARRRRQTLDEDPFKDGTTPTSSRRRRQTFDENSLNGNDVNRDGSRPSSSHTSMSRKSRLSITVLPVILDTAPSELRLTPQKESPGQNGTKTPRSTSRPMSQHTPRNSIKLDPMPLSVKQRASFDSKKVLSSNSQNSTGDFSPPQTPQPSSKTTMESKKASISFGDEPSSPPMATPLERLYSTSKISQGDGILEDAIAGLGLQYKEMKHLKTSFDTIDEDSSGQIGYAQFLRILGEKPWKPGEPSNPFIHKLFQIIDVNRDGGMNFDELLILSATFLMFTHIDMVRYVFECHNKVGPGFFGPQDFEDLSKLINRVVVNGGPKDWETTCDMYDKIGKHKLTLISFPFTIMHLYPHTSLNSLPWNVGKGYLNEAEFIQMSKDYPQLICFASQIQLKLQNISMGQPFFHKLIQRQQRARITDAYKITHGGKPPPENILFFGLRKIIMCFTGDTYDVRTHDNTQLLKLGRSLFDRNVAIQRSLMSKMKSFKSPSPSPNKRPKSARKSFS